MNEEREMQIVSDLARLDGKIDTLTATVNAHLARTLEEIKSLFAKNHETCGRIEAIRVDYVPKRECQIQEKENRDEHSLTAERLNAIQWRVAMIAGGISLAAFLLGILVRWHGAAVQ